MDAIRSDTGIIPRPISGILVAWVREAVWVKHRGVISDTRNEAIGCGCVITEAAAQLRAGHVRPLVSILKSSSSHHHRQRLARLVRGDTGKLPSSDKTIKHAVHVTTDPQAPAYGNIENDRGYQSVRRIVRADRPLLIQAVKLLWVAHGDRPHGIQSADESICSNGGVVHSL